MTGSTFNKQQENGFFDKVSNVVSEEALDLAQTLNIVVVGKVSSGKSSLINALLKLSRKQASEVAQVGALSGVTQKLKILQLDERVCLIDSPGLDDVKAENSKVTKQFLSNIDIGIYVVTGSSDASQKESLEDLRQHCDKVFVVLNKIDAWDHLVPSALEKVVNQWKNALCAEQVYPTCTKGYDLESISSEMDIRGVEKLRSSIEVFLEKKGKDLLLARHMAKKQSYAVKIIATALAAVVAGAIAPGSAVYITAAQGVAIASLHYLYTGKVLSTNAAIAAIPTVLAQNTGSSLFLAAKSFLPPTGIIDLAAVLIAVSVTLAMLAAVNHLLASGHELSETELLQSLFRTYKENATKAAADIGHTNITDKDGFLRIVLAFLEGRYSTSPSLE